MRVYIPNPGGRLVGRKQGGRVVMFSFSFFFFGVEMTSPMPLFWVTSKNPQKQLPEAWAFVGSFESLANRQTKYRARAKSIVCVSVCMCFLHKYFPPDELRLNNFIQKHSTNLKLNHFLSLSLSLFSPFGCCCCVCRWLCKLSSVISGVVRG